MRKSKAIELLGGTVSSAAAEVGVFYQAIAKWPDPLPARLVDRVQAAIARRLLPPAVLGIERKPTQKRPAIKAARKKVAA